LFFSGTSGTVAVVGVQRFFVLHRDSFLFFFAFKNYSIEKNKVL
jgi:hypothetical protein